ncbi:D-aminoacylase [Veronia nyctiphanis]|uniref:D-aminoacylase n=1 Tax=Veronia nyctiphanis TaxID=1278244 RepID=A0A4Q0YP99_9GAMM|nr:D-aminoacylase [Veronia nyctiphanis]RXJ71784.1 D-aminoacylase [Veronia nyctiphanis]
MSARFDSVIVDVMLVDGTGQPAKSADIAISGDRIAAIGQFNAEDADTVFEGKGYCLAPGFIDVHTHDDTNVIHSPEMMAKISQGVTTVIVGNCGISASPVILDGDPPDPMNLLGDRFDFTYPDFASYASAVETARPSVNVAALIGHTSLRASTLSDLKQPATEEQITAMRDALRLALQQGAIGLSSGLAYSSAMAAPNSEVIALACELSTYGGVYTTHLRSEFAEILAAMDEAFEVGDMAKVPVVLSHHKCAGKANWGRTKQTLAKIDEMRCKQHVALDCYPYTASSSNLDIKQVTADYDIQITWSDSEPDQAGRLLVDIAKEWGVSIEDAARRLQPAGAVYHCMLADDLERVLSHPACMVGSDGLPNDPKPHPRLWGTFPRVLGHYSRDLGLLTIEEAVRKMTGLSASEFGLVERGVIKVGNYADLVLFNPEKVKDVADYQNPVRQAEGIHAVWVNGELSFTDGKVTQNRRGRLLRRASSPLAKPMKGEES